MNLFLYLITGFQLFKLGFKLLCVALGIILAKLFPDHLHLLPKNIFPLVFIHPFLHLCLNFPGNLNHFNFFGHKLGQNLKTHLQIDGFQTLLALLIFHRKIYA